MNKETRVILGGGFLSKSQDGGKAFCEEVAKNHESPVRMLHVMFAQEENTWAATSARYTQLFETMVPQKKIESHTAEPVSLEGQIESADVVLFHGGSPALLLEFLTNPAVLKEALAGKTVVGISAGVYALSAFFLDVSPQGEPRAKEGLGVVPVKTATHHGSAFYPEKYPEVFTWEKADQVMQLAAPELEYLPLKEGAFAVVEKSNPAVAPGLAADSRSIR